MSIRKIIRTTVATLWVLSTLILALAPSQSRAHELRPTIANITFDSERVEMLFAISVEPFLAGINLSTVDNTEDAPQSADHDALRALSPAEIETLFRAAWPTLGQGFTLNTNSAVLPLEITAISTPEIGNPELPRDTILTLSAKLPEGARPTTFTWGETYGLLALRSDGLEDDFETLLNGGDTVRLSKPTAMQLFMNYIKIGFEHIVPKGLDHILFVLGLFFFSTRFRPLLWQVTTFTAAHTLTLALAITGTISLSASIVEPLIALSIAYVAVENILGLKFGPRRIAVVFGFGLLHGLGFAGVLSEIGLTAGSFALGLIAFNIGVEIGQLAVLAVAWILIASWAANRPDYRQKIAIPVSILIGITGLYWTIERVFF